MSKKDVKNLVILLFITAAACIAGFFTGRGIQTAQDGGFNPSVWFDECQEGLSKGLFGIWLITSAAACLAAQIFLRNIRRRISVWEKTKDANDDILDLLERRMFVPSTIAQIMMVINMLSFPICFYLSEHYTEGGNPNLIFWSLVLFFLNYVWIFVTMERCVRLEKKLNPEKQGSFLELNFQKKWVNSSDEAQKFILYQSGYKAFRAGNTACLILWLVTFIGTMSFDTGIFAVVVVCIIWLSMVIAFIATDMKLESR